MSKYVIFSFDDGRTDQYEIAYKTLKKFGFPATINVVSEFINNPTKFECFGTMQNKSLTWNNLIEMEKDGNWEIACHGATHNNSVDDIREWLSNDYIVENGWNKNVGFASPGSFLTVENCEDVRRMLDCGELIYIRSGKQIRREGIKYVICTLINRIIKSKKLFVSMNRDCILHKNKEAILMSIGITAFDTVDEICALIQEVQEEEAIILMFHSIIENKDIPLAKDFWYWEKPKLESLCDFLNNDINIRVITTKEWCRK